MKIFEETNRYRKEFVFDIYTRVIEDFKDYEKITKKQMIKKIYEVYANPKNILDICTYRELKYLKLYLEKNKEYLNEKYDWERRTLSSKFLIDIKIALYNDIEIYEEAYESIKKALEIVNWQEVKRKTELNETLVSFCKIQGTFLEEPIIEIFSKLLQKDSDTIRDHIDNNRVFKFYVCKDQEYIESIDRYMDILIFNDYYYIKDALADQRAKQGVGQFPKLEKEDYKSLFYNPFNLNNKKIKKFYDALNKLPFFSTSAYKPIQEYALLNLDRKSLKEAIETVPALKDIDLTDFFKLMDEAMDEMNSGALNGITPNELKEFNKTKKEAEINKSQRFIKQVNARLNPKDVKLFYKLYFALLDYTNKKYKVHPEYDIKKYQGIDHNKTYQICQKLWESINTIIDDFCKENPYRFNKVERNLIKEFKNGIRNRFILFKYEKEYTPLMTDEKTYMIKGLTDNIDNIIPYENLPVMIETSIIPFKGYLIYDGLFGTMPINFGPNFTTMASNQYDKQIKYYHM